MNRSSGGKSTKTTALGLDCFGAAEAGVVAERFGEGIQEELERLLLPDCDVPFVENKVDPEESIMVSMGRREAIAECRSLGAPLRDPTKRRIAVAAAEDPIEKSRRASRSESSTRG